jgi:hypothetical protein
VLTSGVEPLVATMSEANSASCRRLHVPATAKAVFVGSAPTQVAIGALSVSLGALVADRPRICVFRVTLAMKFLNETTYRVADSTRINFVIVMQIL